MYNMGDIIDTGASIFINVRVVFITWSKVIYTGGNSCVNVRVMCITE